MRIGILLPTVYASTEKYPSMIFAPRDLAIDLSDGLVDKGHEVTLYSSGSLRTRAKLVPADDELLRGEYVLEKMRQSDPVRFKWASFYMRKRNYEMGITARCYKDAMEGKLDVVHAYHDHLAHYFNDVTGFPTVYTLHDPLPTSDHDLVYRLYQQYKDHNYISISDAYRRHNELHLNFIRTVYHGLNLEHYNFSDNPQGYAAFMGRFVPQKGLEYAIDAVNKVGAELKVASSIKPENLDNDAYYKDIVKPRLADAHVTFEGFMSGSEKSAYLEAAKYFLFPIQWEEPFGMVMIEAMACGTPVVAFNRGSVPEIVKDGVTGFIIDPDDEDRPGKGNWIIKKQGVDGIVEAISKIGEIDRAACRSHVEEHFTFAKMVEGHEEVYKVVSGK